MWKQTVIAIFMVFMLCSGAVALERSFAWTPNSETNLAGYKIYYGSQSGNYTAEVDCGLPEIQDDQIIYTMDMPNGELWVAATAYDADGFESDFSNEVHLMPVPPGRVDNFRAVTIHFNQDGSITVVVNEP